MANANNLKPFHKGYDPRRGVKPRGTKHISTLIKQLMNDEEFTYQMLQGYEVTEYKGVPAEAIVRVAITKALGGDVRWAEWLAKYGWGRLRVDDLEQQVNPIQFICVVPVTD